MNKSNRWMARMTEAAQAHADTTLSPRAAREARNRATLRRGALLAVAG